MKLVSLVVAVAQLANLAAASPLLDFNFFRSRETSSSEVVNGTTDANRTEAHDVDIVNILNKKDSKTFSLNQVANSDYQKPDAVSALLLAIRKYSGNVPEPVKKAIDNNPTLKAKVKSKIAGTTASVAAYPAAGYDSEYVVPVQIGTPPQIINLNLDTGSSDLWTFSTDTNGATSSGHTLYRPKQSKTSKLVQNASWSVRYGDGASASGILYLDRVQIGNTVVANQGVQSAKKVSAEIISDTFSNGILGLAWSSINTVRPTRQRSYMENVLPTLAAPVFTANLKKGTVGNYNFGFIDKALYTGSIQYVRKDLNQPFWKFTVSGYQIGKNSYQNFPYSAIVDTGTTLLLVPNKIVTSYWSKVVGAKLDPNYGVYTFPCTSVLPDFYLGIGGYRGRVPGPYVNYGPIGGGKCYGGLQSSDGIGFSIIGDIALKAQFVVFHYGTKSIGFANKLV